jgi:hypothetical protein
MEKIMDRLERNGSLILILRKFDMEKITVEGFCFAV